MTFTGDIDDVFVLCLFRLGRIYSKEKSPGFKTDMFTTCVCVAHKGPRRVLVGRKSEGRKLNNLRNDVGKRSLSGMMTIKSFFGGGPFFFFSLALSSAHQLIAMTSQINGKKPTTSLG